MNTVITIKPDQFHNLSGNMYPKKELTNQIGAGMGIEFSSKVELMEVFGDLEEYPDGRKVRKVEGYRCIKHGRRRRPDGSWGASSPGIYEFNWINRAELDFLNDEDGKKRYYFPDDPSKQKRARALHIQELKKFAAQRASTGAELCVIRELTGMPTAFKIKDVAKGQILVSQIVDSQAYQMEQARAHIDNIRKGGISGEVANDAAALLIGKKPDVSEDIRKNETPAAVKEKKADPPKSEKPAGLKEQFEELRDIDGIDRISPIYSEYAKTVEENKYSEEVLTWAITEIMTQVEGMK